jgi:RNA polymerase-binding transcription factor DksA
MPTKKKAPAATPEEKVKEPVAAKPAEKTAASKSEPKAAAVAKPKAAEKAPAADKAPVEKPAATKSAKPSSGGSAPKKPSAAAKPEAAPKAMADQQAAVVKEKAAPASKPKAAAPAKPAQKTASTAKPAPTKAAAPKPVAVERPEPEPIIATTAPQSKQAAIQRQAIKQEEQRKVAKAQQEVTKTQKPIPLPKITTTASRKYEPEFTRSILDQPVQEPIGPSMRYSDAELLEFKELITRKLETARKEIAYLHGMITRKDAMSGEDSDSRYMTMEDGSLSMEREQLSQMASRQHDFIEKLENALVRIENKTYGVCRVTGKLIDKARLRAVPHATLTMEAKLGLNKNPNIQ